MINSIKNFKNNGLIYYYGYNISLDVINEFLESVKNEFNKIIIKYIWTSQTLSRECLMYATIFDSEDIRISREITTFEDWRKYCNEYLGYLESSTNEIIYFKDSNVEIKCIR